MQTAGQAPAVCTSRDRPTSTHHISTMHVHPCTAGQVQQPAAPHPLRYWKLHPTHQLLQPSQAGQLGRHRLQFAVLQVEDAQRREGAHALPVRQVRIAVQILLSTGGRTGLEWKEALKE